MQPGDGEKLNRIEELKSKLFNKNYQTKIEHRDSFPHFVNKEVSDSWNEEDGENQNFREKFFMKTTMFKKFFIFSIIFFVLALGYAAYMFFANSNSVSNDNIDISVLSNAYTNGGEDYPLLLGITNRNNSSLDLVDLVVEYPRNSQTSSADDNEHLRISLGTIPAGGVKDENVKLVFFGEQGSTRHIKISLEYRVEGSNAIFVKEKDYDVSIDSTPINISVDGPTETSSNQGITLNVKTTLNSTKAISNMLLKIDYPIGFQFASATPAPTIGNNVWDLGDLAPGAEHNISISGKMVDVFDGEQKVFRVWTGSQSSADKSMIDVVFNSLDHTLLVKKSAIEATLVINGVSQGEYAVDTKTPIQAQIQWKNNLETKINNLKITANITGNAVNKKTITASGGFYDSTQDLISWDRNSQDKFAEVSPGDSGVVSFSVSPISLFSALGGIVSSPSISVDVSVTGDQAQDGGSTTSLSNTESKVIKIISDLGFSNKALYYGTALKNTGPIPPKVGQKTTFTMTWSLSNTANSISKAQIRTTLPSWMRFVGTFSPASEDLSYNSTTREILWNIGGIPRGTGITGAGRDISFQVEFTPSLSQVGTTPIIMNESLLTGHDDFANVDVKVSKPSLSTRLLNDPNFPNNGGNVIE